MIYTRMIYARCTPKTTKTLKELSKKLKRSNSDTIRLAIEFYAEAEGIKV